jgi:glycosyltransferase involved in cell wall biosynthesis
MLRWFVIWKTTKFMVKYEYLKKLLIETGIDGEKIVVVPHWIDGEQINKKTKVKGIFINNIKPSDYVFVFFGRLAKEKGPDILLDAFALLTKKIENIKLIFIGDGLLRGGLEETCEKYDIKDKVIFLGMQPHEKLFEYISLADIIVFPHRYFNYEWVLLEAMYTEKAIIATDMPATTDILIDGYNALLAEPTVESLSMKMQEILENPNLAKNALRTIKEKHSMKNLEKYEWLVKGIVE